MNRRCTALGFSLLCLSLGDAAARDFGLDSRPLKLEFGASMATGLSEPTRIGANRAIDAHTRIDRGLPTAGSRRGLHFAPSRPSLRQQALHSVIVAAEQDTQSLQSGNGGANFRFERQGSAFKNISRGYQNMCATLSGKVWDDPNGRRIKFDSAGKPGVAVVIPLR